ncbi:MAG: sigma-54 factor interaction domain-containing protein, partial [Deltaproteobacteria bacterium]|nr:sigma-54 factor interaction domain-containing protein [Deltaproteobacteria bacterium]
MPPLPTLCPSLTPSRHKKAGKTIRFGWLSRGASFRLVSDEVGEFQPDLQVKLLRVLEKRAFYRIGG